MDAAQPVGATAVPTIRVRLKRSRRGATGQINVNDFDPELHERLDAKASRPDPPPAPSGNRLDGYDVPSQTVTNDPPSRRRSTRRGR